MSFAGLADDSTANPIESNIPVQQDLVIIQQVDNIQDEENCVLVNGDGLHFVPLKEHKHRAYKVLSLSIYVPYALSVCRSLPLSSNPFN